MEECTSDITISEINDYNVTIKPYRPNAIQQIIICEVDNGYEVEVGCKSFVFETQQSLLKYLKMYLKNPNLTEDKFNNNKLFNQ